MANLAPLCGFILMIIAGFALDFQAGHWAMFTGYILWTGRDAQRS